MRNNEPTYIQPGGKFTYAQHNDHFCKLDPKQYFKLGDKVCCYLELKIDPFPVYKVVGFQEASQFAIKDKSDRVLARHVDGNDKTYRSFWAGWLGLVNDKGEIVEWYLDADR